ncbi:MAG: YggT family protein [Thermoleophilia bacterium]
MSKIDIINFIDAIFLIFYLLVIIRIVFSWIGLPKQKAVFVIFKFSYDATEWYLRIFRRLIPTAGAIDFSPMIAMFSLFIIQQIIISVIREV